MADGPSDFDLIRGMGERDYAAELPGMAETRMALDRMRDMQSRMVAQQQQQDPMEMLKGVDTVTYKKTPDGKTTMSVDGADPRFVQDLFRKSKQLDEIMGAFHQEAARLQLQESVQMRQPWMQLATALSANLAQARDMPGWVQALGRTAEQLNPPVDVLRARRMGVMQQEAQIAERAGALDIAARRTKLESQRERSAILRDNMAAAVRGEIDPAAAAEQIKSMGLMDEKQATAYAANLEGIKRSYEEKRTKEAAMKFESDMKIAMVRAGIDEEKQNRLFEHQDQVLSTRLAAEDRRLAAREDAQAAKEAKKEKTAEEKQKTLAPVQVKQLSDLNAADQALDQIEQILKDPKLKAHMGPMAGRITQANPYRDPEVQGDISKLKLQTANAIKATGAGARGFGPMERPFFEGMAEAITHTPEQNQKILEAWRAYIDQERRAMMLAVPTADWTGKYKPALGRVGTGLAPTETGPPAGLEEKLRTLPKGKGIKVGDHIYTLENGKVMMVK